MFLLIGLLAVATAARLYDITITALITIIAVISNILYNRLTLEFVESKRYCMQCAVMTKPCDLHTRPTIIIIISSSCTVNIVVHGRVENTEMFKFTYYSRAPISRGVQRHPRRRKMRRRNPREGGDKNKEVGGTKFKVG